MCMCHYKCNKQIQDRELETPNRHNKVRSIHNIHLHTCICLATHCSMLRYMLTGQIPLFVSYLDPFIVLFKTDNEQYGYDKLKA